MASSGTSVGMLARVAWRNLWRHKRRSLITASAMAVALGMCMAVIAINGWNRMNVAFRTEVGGYVSPHAAGR